jgi:plasmid stabilization system protein ParE
MGVELIIAPEADYDLDEAYSWYEKQRAGLGEELLTSVDACIASICRTPKAGRLVHENYRRSLIRRFPYAVFYEYESTIVTVYCVIHTARDPKTWQERLP